MPIKPTALLMAAIVSAATAADDITVAHVQQVHRSAALDAWCVSPNVKVFRDQKLPRVKVAPAVVLRAARAEQEPVQLVLRSPSDIAGLSIRFSDAPGAGAASCAGWLRANPIGFIDVAQTSSARTLGKRAYPDALMKRDTFDVKAGENAIVWLTASIPASAAPGEHACVVNVVQGSKTLLSFRLVVRVWSFTLPKEMPIFIQGNFWRNSSWMQRYTSRDMSEMTKEYFLNMAAHRCNTAPGFAEFPFFAEGETPADKTDELRQFDAMAKFVLDDLGFKRWRMPYGSAAGGMGTGVWRGHPVMQIPAEEGDLWVNAVPVKERFLAGEFPGAKWFADWGMRLMVGQAPDPSVFDGSYIEYEIEIPKAGEYRCWIEGRHYAPIDVRVDGASMGVVAKGGEGFKQAQGALKLAPGKHTLRLVVAKARRGTSAFVRRVFLSCRPGANPVALFAKRGAAPEFLRAYKYHLRTAGRYLASKGWFDKVQVKIGDEPQEPAWPLVCDVARAVREALPHAKTEITFYPRPEFLGLIDIWVPYATHCDPAKLAERQKKGEEVWIYYNALHGIDCPALDPRAIGWLLWRFNFDGYHFWSVNYWPYDPWTTSVSLTRNCFNRGTFIYPDPKDGSPVDSTRWELFREGLDDYLYLHLADAQLAKWAKQRDLDAPARSLRDELAANLDLWRTLIVRDIRTWCGEGSQAGRARRNVGLLLDAAQRLADGAPVSMVNEAVARTARERKALLEQTIGREVWRPGARFDRSHVAGRGDKKWIRARAGAAIVTPGAGGKTNPYDGSWVEYDFAVQEGTYRVWLRLSQHQESEVKEVYVDGRLLGQVSSKPQGKAYTSFQLVPGEATLARGKHTLRIVCRGIVGWIDPIQWIYITADANMDPRTFEPSHASGSIPIRPKSAAKPAASQK